MALSKLSSLLETSPSNSQSPHIIVIVLDALTAHNMSLYGYPRETTPKISHFASRANVYHSHYSAGTYTTPGVASLLTGTYPWTHRAINFAGLVARNRYERNIFRLLESRYNRVGFTQNFFANYLLSQFGDSIDEHLPLKSFSEVELYLTDVEHRNHLSRFRAFDDFLLRDAPSPGSLLLGILNKYRRENNYQKHMRDYSQVSINSLVFDINRVFTGLASHLIMQEFPSFSYFHLLPPHNPYKPKRKFQNLYKDGWKPTAKPKHPLGAQSSTSQPTLNQFRLDYDRFIATIDSAFGRFLNEIEEAGLLEKSYVILTSDHGESFERGYWGHGGPFVYEPCIHIPLIISAPGQTTRHDFHSVTNSVDLLPTLLNISGVEIPDWCEGESLPGYGGTTDNTRITFSMDSKSSAAFGDLAKITIAMYQGDYKTIYYKGYGEEDSPYRKGLFELYNLKEDPEELHNLVNQETVIAKQLQGLLLEAYDKFKQPLT
jgi:arylsulfatase A-like enzyme